MRGAWIGMLGCLLVSCSSTDQPLVVKQFTLRDSGRPEGDDPMVRGEVQRRMYGAVSNSERRDRLGQYYTVEWRDESLVGKPVELVFDYQQAVTGSRVKRETRGFDAQATSGRTEFKFIGEEFRLRSNDAIHLAVAIRLGADEIVTYDHELAQAARTAGLSVFAPGP